MLEPSTIHLCLQHRVVVVVVIPYTINININRWCRLDARTVRPLLSAVLLMSSTCYFCWLPTACLLLLLLLHTRWYAGTWLLWSVCGTSQAEPIRVVLLSWRLLTNSSSIHLARPLIHRALPDTRSQTGRRRLVDAMCSLLKESRPCFFPPPSRTSLFITASSLLKVPKPCTSTAVAQID